MTEAQNTHIRLPDDIEDRAEGKVASFFDAAQRHGIELPGDDAMRDELYRVFSLSEFIAASCIRRPALLKDLLASGDLERFYAPGEYANKIEMALAGVTDETGLASSVRKLRNREMVRIAWRDLTGRADLHETLYSLSAFADYCLAHTLDFLHNALCDIYGTPSSTSGDPQKLVVIGMGKLGGYELNFSSDIDLIFAFPEAGKTTGGASSITNEDFFSKLARRLIDMLTKSTFDGYVFRVDTRLRPYGDGGPLVMSFDAMENYYQMFGRGWERYALIKARPVAGDIDAGRALLERLRPFVFRRYLDYGTFESLREMKNKIEREVIRKGMKDNIKHGAGGIREIEFFGQVFQLIRGGINPSYQEKNLLRMLKFMAEDRCIDVSVYEELAEAYVFLRNTENRLQMVNDMQTHTLPGDDAGQSIMAAGMGFDRWEDFHEHLRAHMARVNRHFSDLLAPESPDPEDAESEQLLNVWHNPEDRDNNIRILADAGFGDPEKALTAIDRIRRMDIGDEIGNIVQDRIDRLMPLVLAASLKTDRSLLVLERIVPLIEAVVRRSCYIALLLENPGALDHLVGLARISPWIVTFLCKHPLLLDELLDMRTLYAPLERAALTEELNSRLEMVLQDDIELLMDEVRVFKQINMFRIVAADVTGNIPLMKVSDRLTFLAETVVEAALDISWRQLVERYGKPSHLSDVNGDDRGFAAIAYGKLGGIELGYGSDLDLVFLHTAKQGQTSGGSFRSLYDKEFYARLGQRVIHFLSTPTATGKLYEADMRLRPSGNAGVLVSHVDAFEDYQIEQAWNWEHQAIIKARPISGDRYVRDRFRDIRRRVITMKRNKAALAREVDQMRGKMLKSRDHATAGRFDLKQDPGGIIDIEFLVQYLILLHAGKHEALAQWTDVVRQLNSLALSDIIDDITAHSLKQAYLVYRYFVHRLTLHEKPPVLPEKRLGELRKRVIRIWKTYLTAS